MNVGFVVVSAVATIDGPTCNIKPNRVWRVDIWEMENTGFRVSSFFVPKFSKDNMHGQKSTFPRQGFISVE